VRVVGCDERCLWFVVRCHREVSVVVRFVLLACGVWSLGWGPCRSRLSPTALPRTLCVSGLCCVAILYLVATYSHTHTLQVYTLHFNNFGGIVRVGGGVEEGRAGGGAVIKG